MLWLRGLGIALILSFVAFASGLAYVLRDNPARDAIGDEHFVTSGDATIQYFARGSGDQRPVVLVASYARSASDFNELVESLNAAGHPTLAVETRGVRGSTLPSPLVSLHTYAGDLESVLAQERLTEPIILLGHAYGNRIVRAFASDYPDRVAALVLLSAGGEVSAAPGTSDRIGKALIRAWPDAARREAVHAAFFAAESSVAEDWVRGWYPLAGVAQVRAMEATPLSEWANAGRAPILVFDPAQDAAAPGSGAALKQRLGERVTLVDVARAGHALLPEQPAFVSRTILDYLGTL